MSRYEDKFKMTIEEANGQNKVALKDALESLYATHIESELIAAHRGKAVQAINNMARMLGFPDIVRND